MDTSLLKWAVVAKSTALNNGVYENFETVCAIFRYPFQAEEFIEKMLPKENKNKFYVKYLED